MPLVLCKTTIDTAVQSVWQLISDFGAAGLYLSGVVACVVEGAGVGAVRTLTSIDQSSIVERLESFDGTARRLSYSLLTATPFRNCLTTMEVHDAGASRTELEWSATFETDGLPESEAVELLEGALAANCQVLKQLLERPAAAA